MENLVMEDVVLESQVVGSRAVSSLGLTPEQAAIVADRGSDMLVTAGAGSGKTRVLVERYVSLLQEHRIPEIAAVTFTDAAAMEMRERVRRELMDRPEMARHRADIDEAIIGTIHSLCYMILREHPVEASIDPAARILSEDEAEFELYQACIDALEEAADADDHRALDLRELSVYHATLNLPLMVERRDEVDAAFRALPGDTLEEWREHIRAMLDGRLGRAVDKVRPQLAEDALWLRNAYKGPVENALSSRMHNCLDTLGDSEQGSWSELLDRLQRASSNIKLQGGSAKTWHVPVADVRGKLGEVRDIAKALEKLPRWNEHDETALQSCRPCETSLRTPANGTGTGSGSWQPSIT